MSLVPLNLDRVRRLGRIYRPYRGGLRFQIWSDRRMLAISPFFVPRSEGVRVKEWEGMYQGGQGV
jgi:hypothetical protein